MTTKHPADTARPVTTGNPGWKTSEFWLAVVVAICALVLTLTNKVDGDVGLGAITAAGGIYGLSRGIAKK